MEQVRLPGPEWSEYHAIGCGPGSVDTLFAAADVLDAENLCYEAEAVAHAAAILAERTGCIIDPTASVSALVEPGLRQRAAQRPLPENDGSPAGQLSLLTALSGYSAQDGREEEAESILESAADLAAELGPGRIPPEEHPAIPALPANSGDDEYVQSQEARMEAHNALAREYEDAAREHRRLGYEAEKAADERLCEVEAASRARS